MEMLGMGPREHSLIAFDANDHRLMRIEELRLSASTASERVRAGRLPYRFSPMTSRERRIIHLAVTNEPGVRSESVGIGPQRGVVVYPADMPSPPATAAPAPPFSRRRR
jgi:spoIIIJ-associated protein